MPPDEAKLQLVQDWLLKARHDLRAARRVMEDPELLDVAVYHCQQAAEKALKGYLVWMDVPPIRTHDLRELVRQCERVDVAFVEILPAARVLAPYAVQFRYPDAQPSPSLVEATEAIDLAHSVHAFIRLLLPFAVQL
ncbi:MAG: HEPN domain-containing protein [Dehalococcoidia bacterium]